MKHIRHLKSKFGKFSKEDKVFYGAVAVLGLSALAFAVLIFAPKISMPKISLPSYSAESKEDKSPASNAANAQVVDPPAQDATKETLAAYFNKINAMAVDAKEIIIGKDCMVTPTYPRLEIGTVLTIKNTDSVSHEMQLNPENNPRVNAGEAVTVKTDFKMGYGTYNFGCDRAPKPAGALILTPKK
jgi:hypothetical protein